VRRWGSALLEADTERISYVAALGLDETLMWRRGRFRAKSWSTSIVDVGRGQLLDIVRGRTAKAPTRWLLGRPACWLEQIRWAVLDLSGPYRVAFDTAIPDAAQVADPFHVVRLGNDALDEVRRRVQNQTLGHRGHKHDPLYRARKLLVSASENVTDAGRIRLRGLLYAGDPYGEVRDAWHAKETLRSVYDIDDAKAGAATVAQLAADLQDPGLPPEINRLGRTISRWRHQIANWHTARVTNAATEAVEQSHQTGQTSRVRVHRLRQLPTESEPCSTPANPTGPCSTPSLHPRTAESQFSAAELGRWRATVPSERMACRPRRPAAARCLAVEAVGPRRRRDPSFL